MPSVLSLPRIHRPLCGLAAFIAGFSSHLSAQTASPESQAKVGTEVLALDPLTVSGDANTGYGAQFSNSSSRLNLKYIDVPQTVNVITSEFLHDAFIFDSRDFSMYVPGISPTSNTHQVETFLVRGLTTTTSYVDGFLATRPVNRDSALYDRIEVVKGPASAAIGRGEAGGLVNFIQKKPLGKKRVQITTTVGSDSFYRGEIDYNDMLRADGSLNLRVPLYYEDGDGSRGGSLMHTEKFGVGPALTWRPFARTEINITTAFFQNTVPGVVAQAFWMHKSQVDAQVDSGTINPAIWYPGPSTPLVPYDNVYGYDSNFRRSKVMEGSIIINHRFNDSLSFRQGFRAERILTDTQQFSNPPGVGKNANFPSGYQLTMTYRREHSLDEGLRSQSDLLYQFEIKDSKHTLLAGFDSYWNTGTTQFGQRGGLTIDLYKPWLTPAPSNFDPETWVTINNNSNNESNEDGYGYYLQYSGSFLANRVQVIAGWRKDTTSSESLNLRNNATTLASATTDVPRYSIAYKPREWMSIYYLHSEQADPKIIRSKWGADTLINGATSYTDGRRQEGERITGQVQAKLDEFGVKANLWQGRVTASLSYFDMSRNGFLASQARTEVGANGIGMIQYIENYVSDGEHVKGLEMNLFGQPTRQLTLVLGAISMQGELPRANGTFTSIVKPTDEISFNGKYSFRDNRRNGFEFTAGGKIWFGGWRVGVESTGTFDENQYVINGGAAYYWKNGRYNVRVRMNNILGDVIFFAGSSQYGSQRVFLSFSADL